MVPNDWTATSNAIRETARSVLGLSSGKRKIDEEIQYSRR